MDGYFLIDVPEGTGDVPIGTCSSGVSNMDLVIIASLFH
jgi:hypothetical protein